MKRKAQKNCDCMRFINIEIFRIFSWKLICWKASWNFLLKPDSVAIQIQFFPHQFVLQNVVIHLEHVFVSVGYEARVFMINFRPALFHSTRTFISGVKALRMNVNDTVFFKKSIVSDSCIQELMLTRVVVVGSWHIETRHMKAIHTTRLDVIYWKASCVEFKWLRMITIGWIWSHPRC